MDVGQRFLVFSGVPNISTHEHCCFIIDFTWWVENDAEITSWLLKNIGVNNFKLEGIVLQFTTAELQSFFLLTWS
jgi:hypothetical protein